MTTCRARLARTLAESPSGFPDPGIRRCGQSVGLRTLYDRDGHVWHACGRAGHTSDVLAQMADAELAERVRHEVEREARPLAGFPEPHTAAGWAPIRPEMAR